MRSFLKPTTNQALSQKLQAYGPACILVGKTLAEKLGVPYYEDRITERFLGHRMKGQPESAFVDGPRYVYKGELRDTWPNDPATGKPVPMYEAQIATEEVWSRDHWPHTADDATAALKHLPDGKITGIYYHGPSMTLVLLHPGGLKVGIRAAALLHPKLGPDKAAIAALEKLKKWE